MIGRLIRRISFRRVTQTINMQGATMRLVVLRGREVIHWAVVHGDEGEQGATNAGGEDVDLAVVHATRLRGFWSEGRRRNRNMADLTPLGEQKAVSRGIKLTQQYRLEWMPASQYGAFTVLGETSVRMQSSPVMTLTRRLPSSS